MVFERRRAFRVTGLSETDAVVVRGRKKLEATLLDQSAEGFQVSLPGNHRIAEAELLVLHVRCDAFVVRVMRSEPRDGQTYLGLLRVSDLLSEADLAAVASKVRSAFTRVTSAAVRGMFLAGVVMACGFVGAIWTGKELAFFAMLNKPTDAVQRIRQALWRESPPIASGVTGVAPVESRNTEHLMRKVFGLNLRAPAGHEKYVDGKLEFLAAVTEPTIARELRMSNAQQQSVRQIMATCRELLSESSAPGAELSPAGLDALQTAHSQVRDLLDEQQLRRLDAMITGTRW